MSERSPSVVTSYTNVAWRRPFFFFRFFSLSRVRLTLAYTVSESSPKANVLELLDKKGRLKEWCISNARADWLILPVTQISSALLLFECWLTVIDSLTGAYSEQNTC